MSFLKDVSPRGATFDLIAYLREKRDYNWLFWIAASLPPIIMIYTFQADASRKSVPPPPQVIYFESWPATRSREESIRAITERQAKKDAYLEKKRQDYEKLGRMIGMDVEQIKREADRIKANARAAAAKTQGGANAKAPAKDKPSAGLNSDPSAAAPNEPADPARVNRAAP